MSMGRVPRYHHLTPSSTRASAAARGSSRKTDTKPELILRGALWRKGFRYQKNRTDLPGAPDIVFPVARVVVFVDGDFWHGKNWAMLRAKLKQGHNAEYWITKLERNRVRDRQRNRQLTSAGWSVIRVWETDIYADLGRVIHRVESTLTR